MVKSKTKKKISESVPKSKKADLRFSSPPLHHSTASAFARDVLKGLEKPDIISEYGLKEGWTRKDGLAANVTFLCNCIAPRDRTLQVRVRLLDLLFNCVDRGFVHGVKDMVNTFLDAHIVDESRVEKIEREIRNLRLKIGEKYPQSILSLIRDEASTGLKVTSICKRIADEKGWDPHLLRQAYYRRYERRPSKK
jgi:hypothetical protein